MAKAFSTLKDIYDDKMPFLPCDKEASRMTQAECESHVAGVFVANYYLPCTNDNDKARLRAYLASMGNKDFMLTNSVANSDENIYLFFVKKSLRGPEINRHFNVYLSVGEDEIRRLLALARSQRA
jgi:hypothetical protein